MRPKPMGHQSCAEVMNFSNGLEAWIAAARHFFGKSGFPTKPESDGLAQLPSHLDASLGTVLRGGEV